MVQAFVEGCDQQKDIEGCPLPRSFDGVLSGNITMKAKERVQTPSDGEIYRWEESKESFHKSNKRHLEVNYFVPDYFGSVVHSTLLQWNRLTLILRVFEIRVLVCFCSNVLEKKIQAQVGEIASLEFRHKVKPSRSLKFARSDFLPQQQTAKCRLCVCEEILAIDG